MSSGFLTVSEADLLLNTCLTISKADHNICVDEFSLKGETLRPASHKQIQGEAPQNTVLDQQSEVPKDSGKVEAPPFPADKLDGSCPPEETVSCLGLPALNESKASAPTELTGRGYGRPFESMSVIHSDGQRAQAPETSTMLGSGEPALHHIVSPAEYTIGKDKYQPGEFNLAWMKSIYRPSYPMSHCIQFSRKLHKKSVRPPRLRPLIQWDLLFHNVPSNRTLLRNMKSNLNHPREWYEGQWCTAHSHQYSLMIIPFWTTALL